MAPSGVKALPLALPLALLALLAARGAHADAATRSHSMRAADRDAFAALDADGDGVLSRQEFAALGDHERTLYVSPASFLEVHSQLSRADPAREDRAQRISDALQRGGRRVGGPPGCYRVCPQPVVFRNGEPFGGPFGPDPYYSYGQNHLY